MTASLTVVEYENGKLKIKHINCFGKIIRSRARPPARYPPAARLAARLSARPPARPPARLSTRPATRPLVIHLSLSQFVSLSACLFGINHLSVCLSIYQFICPSISPSVS